MGRGRQVRNAPFLFSSLITEERMEGGAEVHVEVSQVGLAETKFPVRGAVKSTSLGVTENSKAER